MMPTPDQGAQEILVVEPDAALRRVMALGLRQHGMHVREARSLGEAWDLASAPAVVVLDVGLGANSEWMLLNMLRMHRRLSSVPLVVVAWDCPIEPQPAGESATRWLCLTKPFDARVLHAAVAGLLATPAAVPTSAVYAVARDLNGDAGVPAGTPSAAASSIWPLVAAAGATLALIGLMLHPALVIAGLVICFAAALLWGGEAFETATSPRRV